MPIIPPVPDFESSTLTNISGATWHSASINDPSGTPLGQLKDASGNVVAV